MADTPWPQATSTMKNVPIIMPKGIASLFLSFRHTVMKKQADDLSTEHWLRAGLVRGGESYSAS